jgi:hypothetical protein
MKAVSSLANLTAAKLLALAVIPWLQLLGCGPGNLRPTELTPKEQQVQLFDNGEAPTCTLFEDYGPITVESGSSMTPGTFASSKAKLQRAAAELGATAVRITTHNVSGKIDRATGVAIKCIKREGQ